MRDLISVVMPTYNRASFLRRSIPCVLAQTHKNVELVVIDDGSTDDTHAVLAEFGDSILVIKQHHQGVSVARNSGMLASRGDYIAFLDSDDLWAEEFLEKQLAALQDNPDCDVCYCWYKIVDADGNLCRAMAPTFLGNVFDYVYLRNTLITPHLLARRSCFLQGGALFLAYQPNMKVAEDYKVRLELALRHRFCCVPEYLVSVTKHPGSTHSTSDIDEMVACMSHLEDFLWSHEPAARRLRQYEGRARASWSVEIAYLYLLAKNRRRDALRYLWKAFKACPYYPKLMLVVVGILAGRGTIDRIMRFLHGLKPGVR